MKYRIKAFEPSEGAALVDRTLAIQTYALQLEARVSGLRARNLARALKPHGLEDLVIDELRGALMQIKDLADAKQSALTIDEFEKVFKIASEYV